MAKKFAQGNSYKILSVAARFKQSHGIQIIITYFKETKIIGRMAQMVRGS